jgi:UDP-N-acetyl-D-mannosaminuronate dehydrogenase
LFESAPPDRTQVIRAARARNAQMPAEVLGQVETVLGTLQGKGVVIVGAAYRRGVHELRYSNTEDLVQLLEAKGATAYVWDPTFTVEELAARGYTAWDDSETADCVLIQSGIEGIDSLDWEQAFPKTTLVVDGRRALERVPKLAAASLFAAVGSPWPQAGH